MKKSQLIQAISLFVWENNALPHLERKESNVLSVAEPQGYGGTWNPCSPRFLQNIYLLRMVFGEWYLYLLPSISSIFNEKNARGRLTTCFIEAIRE